MISPAVRKRLAQIGFLVLIQAVVLFASARTWKWWNVPCEMNWPGIKNTPVSAL